MINEYIKVFGSVCPKYSWAVDLEPDPIACRGYGGVTGRDTFRIISSLDRAILSRFSFTGRAALFRRPHYAPIEELQAEILRRVIK